MNHKQYVNIADILRNYRPDQAVIVKEKYLPTLLYPKYRNEETIDTTKTDDEWYPLVNSYYPFTEDVDAYARVNHLLETKQSFDSFQSKISLDDFFKEEDGYSERAAHLQYLHSKPISFLILGKPEIGQEDLGRRLAEYWKCVYITPQTLLEEELSSGSRSGKCIEFNLRCGRSVGVDVILRLLAKKVQTESARHRGYVICGFPLVANDLFEEDPISSESAVFTVQDIFDEILENAFEFWDDSIRQVSLSMKSKSQTMLSNSAIAKEMADDESSIDKGLDIEFQTSTVTFSDAICGPPEIENDSDKQLKCLFGFFRKLFIIIYPVCGNTDVISQREHCLYDIYTKNNIEMQKVRCYFEGGASDGLLEDLFSIPNSSLTENPNLRHLVRVPENFPANVATQLDRYHSTCVNMIDHEIMLHSAEFVIKVDGRALISDMLAAIKLRLKILPLQKVLLPINLSSAAESALTSEDDPLDKGAATMTNEEAFLKYSRQQIVSPQYTWKWSDWKEFCPVAMKNGEYKKGNSNYVVQFLNNIFFLANEQNFKKFQLNPRNYLLPPYPKPGGNIFIFGPPASGKSAIASCLGYVVDSRVLVPKEMTANYVAQKEEEYKEKIRQAAIIEAIQVLEMQHQEDIHRKELEAEDWENRCKAIIREWTAILQQFENSTDDVPDSESFQSRLTDLNIPFKLELNFFQDLLQGKNDLYEYLPEHLKISSAKYTVLDEFVVKYAEEKVKNCEPFEVELTEDNIVDMYLNNMKLSEEIGWIIDGMPMNTHILREVCEIFLPDHVIVLKDTSDYQFLIDRLEPKYQNRFNDYRELFLSIGERDAAWRCPSETVMEKMQTVDEILSDILNADASEDSLLHAKEARLNQYKIALDEYQEKLPEIEQTLKELNLEVIDIVLTDSSIEDLMIEAVNRIRDYYRRCASEFTDGDRAEEVQAFMAEYGEGGEEGGESTKDVIDIEKFRKYGDTYHYCPVTYVNNWVLWKGKDEYTVMFKNKIYKLSCEEDMKSFLRRPRKYMTKIYPSSLFPPPRICIEGVEKSGKTTISKLLAQNLGVHYMNFEEFFLKEKQKFESEKKNTEEEGENEEEVIKEEGEEEMMEENVEEEATLNRDAVVKKFINELWFEEPTRTIGFVADDFPKLHSDVVTMLSLRAIPDTVIHIAMQPELIRERRLQFLMNAWRAQMDEEREIEEKKNYDALKEWEEVRNVRYNELMEQRREARYSTLVAQESKTSDEDRPPEGDTNFLSETQVSLDSVAEQKDMEDISKILDDEYPEPVFSMNWETEEGAIERFNATILDSYDVEFEEIQLIKSTCDAELIPWSEVNGNGDVEKVITRTCLIADKIKFRGESLFECCYDVTPEVAEKLLEKGYFFPSKFGRTCPVQYHDAEEPLQLFRSSEKKSTLYPVIHRSYIYFLAGKKNRNAFVRDPLKYIKTRNFNFVLLSTTLSIVGPPKCGKTALARRYVRDFAYKFVSRGEAIRYTLNHLPFCVLSKSMEALLRKGEELPDQWVMESVAAYSLADDGMGQGLVFDGFPNTITEATWLSKLGLVPNLIIDLVLSEDEIFEFAAHIDPPIELPIFSRRLIKYMLELWKVTAEDFRKWCKREYQNIYTLPVRHSMWGVYEVSKKVNSATCYEKKHYHKHAYHDWPLRLGHMLVTPLEFLERKSDYLAYCPVCIKLDDVLTFGGDPPERTGLVQYKHFFYWICPKHIEEFLKCPDHYLIPNNKKLPADLPGRQKLSEWPENADQNGYCVVCYLLNKPKRVLNMGCIEFALSYLNKIYLFDTEACLDAFVARPQKFATVQIKSKALVEYAPINCSDLPVMGYLEQHISRQVVKAVNHVNLRRPVIPGLSISQSAMICIGIELKLQSETTDEEQLKMHKKALELFHQRRTHLLEALDLMKTYLNAHLKYNEHDREFDDEDADECEEHERRTLEESAKLENAQDELVHEDDDELLGKTEVEEMDVRFDEDVEPNGDSAMVKDLVRDRFESNVEQTESMDTVAKYTVLLKAVESVLNRIDYNPD